ncbi:MAG: FAD-dependent oxidoreductase [Nannocystales bacterium]
MKRKRVLVLGGGCAGVAAAWALSSTPHSRRRFEVTLLQSGWRLGGKGATGRDPTRGHAVLEHGLHLWLGFYRNAFAMVRDLYDHWNGPSDGPQRSLESAFTPAYDVSLRGAARGASQQWTLNFPQLPGRPWDPSPGTSWLATSKRWLQQLPSLLGGIPKQDRPLLVSLGRTVARGLAREWARWGDHAWDQMDREDLRTWLARHGATREVTDSPPVVGLYDLGFAYPHGRQSVRDGRAAAGVAVRVLLRMFADYRGAPLWRMSAGMGDTVFSPAWDVLRARGVTLSLFHHVLEVRAEHGKVSKVRVGIQASGFEDYDPLIDVGPIRAWPERPIESRLTSVAPGALDGDGSQIPDDVELHHGRDFDAVVMAIPAAAQRHCAIGLAKANPRYGAMLEACHTVPTVSGQVWMSRSADTLGPDAEPTVSTGHHGLFRTHANMTDVLKAEAWRESPRHLAYLCGVAPPDVLAASGRDEAHARLRELAEAWFRHEAPASWPGSATPSGHFDEGSLHVDPGGRREDAIYLRANTEAWERYVLSLPGTTAHRLAPDDSGFENLFLAGDWTRNEINGGSVEAAVSSGMSAARAIEAQ